jgi:subfamily B ATP-binding cassette protein MsbA
MASAPHIFKRLHRAGKYFARPYSAWVAAFTALLIVSVSEPMVPALLQPLLDKGFKQNSFPIWMVPVALIGLYSVRGASMFIGNVAIAKATHHGLLKLRMAMFERLQDADLKLFRQQNASALGNTLVYEVQNGAQLLVSSCMGLFRDSLTLLALIGYLLYLNWQLSLIVALLIPSVAFLMKAMSKRLYHLTRTNQAATDELAYVVEETALAYREIRLHGAQATQGARFATLGRTLERLTMKMAVAGSGITPLTQLFSAVALSAVISVALLQSQDSGMSVGSFASFVTAMLMLVNPIKHLSEVASPITRGLAALERGLELIESTPQETGGSHRVDKSHGHLQFLNTGVRYQPDHPWALKDVQLEIKPGETVALVGSSGSGKTTLANLLPRFVDLSEGDVLLDGVSLKHWDLQALRKQFAMVSQNVVVLNDSLAVNVALGQTPEPDKVLKCLEAANLGDYLGSLPKGIDTVVGHNASSMSGGQRQRLAIARALYKDAPILILDEATSALDNESERAVQEALTRLQQGKTTLIIAHRLSTIESADRIVVMDAGRVIEMGNHANLLAANGAYAAMFKLKQLDAQHGDA